jgi:uncharacterized protein YyaL (SSP411 family)
MEYGATNRLAKATSPYLLQHANNPVDWWPWCPEALARARQENRPILLSIGYSACHWCHVMAHESFEDPETAALMNQLYVNIKVDREERPDLDKIYQSAYQLLARRAGGWPLTVFLTPDDHAPFFAGTYYPPAPRHGLPAFKDLIRQIHNAYHEQPQAIREQNRVLIEALRQLESGISGTVTLTPEPLDQAEAQLTRDYDATHGGFGQAPKFPHPSSLEFLLRRWLASGREPMRILVQHTLERMARGGVNDQLGGGFCRYSVDAAWMIPHFEKMLYDNGSLLALYADAWQAMDHAPLFARVCEHTAEWVMREMQAPDGGYYSSLDADSAGEEGAFYVWNRNQVAARLDAAEYRVFSQRFGLNKAPNFEGRWHLHTFADNAHIAEATGLDAAEVRRLLERARNKLFALREQRVRPGRDEKVLTSWNALMIRGMARAGRIFGQAGWITSAERALDFLRQTHWSNGRLLATSKDGNAHLAAYLDDHAYLIDALLEMLQARWRTTDLEWAQALAELLLSYFRDPDDGGLYFTADDHEILLHRPKSYSDDATPSGNGVAALVLQRLGHLLGEARYLEAADEILRAAWSAINQLPYAHPSLLIALNEHLDPAETLVIRGAPNRLADWTEIALTHGSPRRQVFTIPHHAGTLPGLLADQPTTAQVTAYWCRGTACEAPLRDLDELQARLAR